MGALPFGTELRRCRALEAAERSRRTREREERVDAARLRDRVQSSAASLEAASRARAGVDDGVTDRMGYNDVSCALLSGDDFTDGVSWLGSKPAARFITEQQSQPGTIDYRMSHA